MFIMQSFKVLMWHLVKSMRTDLLLFLDESTHQQCLALDAQLRVFRSLPNSALQVAQKPCEISAFGSLKRREEYPSGLVC